MAARDADRSLKDPMIAAIPPTIAQIAATYTTTLIVASGLPIRMTPRITLTNPIKPMPQPSPVNARNMSTTPMMIPASPTSQTRVTPTAKPESAVIGVKEDADQLENSTDEPVHPKKQDNCEQGCSRLREQQHSDDDGSDALQQDEPPEIRGTSRLHHINCQSSK